MVALGTFDQHEEGDLMYAIRFHLKMGYMTIYHWATSTLNCHQVMAVDLWS